MSELLLEQVDPLRPDSRWDADLAAFPDASFFHTEAWARVLHGAYGFKPVYFVARASGRLQSLVPLMEVDSWLTGRRGVCLPFTDECGPLCADSASFRLLCREALEFAKTRHWKYMELRGGRNLFAGAPAWASFYGHQLDLRGGETSLFAGVESSVRRAVRKAGQSDLTIEFSRDLEAVRVFHRLLRKSRKRHGVPLQPFSFFASIHRHVLAKDLGCVVLARQAGVPVAGAVYFQHGGTVVYKYGASDAAFQHLRANNRVMWEAIRHYAREGFSTLDFGRTSLENEGLRKFKLGWGASERRVEYMRHERSTGGFAAGADAGPGWRTRFLKLLPEPILQLIGAALYKHAA